jgi:hypothetical protein
MASIATLHLDPFINIVRLPPLPITGVKKKNRTMKAAFFVLSVTQAKTVHATAFF